eukprot:scaffold10288_cov137-Skeletonema_marinoi.AAC.2
MARPIPVFPEVGSTRTVFPGVICPRASASEIMERAIRSLTLLAGLDDSSLATISAPDSEVTLLSLTRGVCPISSRMLLAILGRASEKRVVEVVVRVLVVEDGAKAVAPVARVARVRMAAESFMVFGGTDGRLRLDFVRSDWIFKNEDLQRSCEHICTIPRLTPIVIMRTPAASSSFRTCRRGEPTRHKGLAFSSSKIFLLPPLSSSTDPLQLRKIGREERSPIPPLTFHSPSRTQQR